MVFDPASAPHLKPWLVRTLEPICDAEPGALADYILALLKHNVPETEMRKELAVQLDEFLEKECSSFIDTLFTVLRTKSYLPYSAAPPSQFPSKSQDAGIPIPLDGLVTPVSPGRTRKRSNTDDERDGRPPTKGPRLNSDAQVSRYSNGGDGRLGAQSSGGWNRPQGNGYQMGGYAGQMGAGQMGVGQMGVGQMGIGQMGNMGMNGMGLYNRRPQAYQPPDQKRGICRDYHNNGYCARGAMCKYSHGDDAVIPDQLFPMNVAQGGPGMGMPFMPMFPGNGNGLPFMMGAAYDPHEARMDMRPMNNRGQQRAPLLPRVQQEDGSRVLHPVHASGELPVIQDLTPVIPREPTVVEPIPQGDVDMHSSNSSLPSSQAPQAAAGHNSIPGPADGNGYQPVPSADVEMTGFTPGMRPPSNRGQFRGRGHSGRGRGTFGGEVHNFRPEKRNDKTLVVEKIPEDKLSLESVNEWFKRFGTVTNVAIDAMSAKALVSFLNHDEAYAAWKSEDAVFGNRFVKVFWHRPLDGHGQAGARMLAASGPLVANMSTKPSPSIPQPAPSAAPAAPIVASSSTSDLTAVQRKPSTAASTSTTLSALAAKQQLLEKTIAEQKTLMASLDTASSEEKKGIMARLRKLGEEMKTLTAPASSTTATVAAGKKPADKLTDHERKERERLDEELDMRNSEEPAPTEEKTEDLKVKLERLKAEAASLGLDSALPSTSTPFRGGYRGRGRGAPRSYFRGAAMRGGPPRASMKLDNRPKKLLVKGVAEKNSQALKDWYETTGQLDNVEAVEEGAYLVSFKTRSAAEQGLSKGSNIPIVGSVQITWHTGKGDTSSTTTQATKPPVNEASSTSGTLASSNGGSEITQSPEMALSHLQEEEIVASGWGGDGDDGDGMGML